MSIRLLHPTLLHPKTGLPLVAAGVLPSGKILWPVLGAAPDDPADPGSQSGGTEDEDGEDSAGKEGGGTTDKDKPVSREDFERLRRQLQASDRSKAAAEKKAKELEDKDKDELTKVSEKATTLEKENETLKQTNSALRLENAFLNVNTVTWHSVKTALRTAREEGLLEDVMQEDGKVDEGALKKALAELRKNHPYLVKSEEQGEKDKTKEDKKEKEKGGPTGGPVGAGRSQDGKPTDDYLKRKYRALRN